MSVFLLFITSALKPLLENKLAYLIYNYSIYLLKLHIYSVFLLGRDVKTPWNSVRNSMELILKLHVTCFRTPWKNLKNSMELPELVRITDFFFWKRLLETCF